MLDYVYTYVELHPTSYIVPLQTGEQTKLILMST